MPAGAPLRLYLTRRVSKRAGAPVKGKLMEPVFAFDREVVPAGSILAGQVSRIRPRPKWQRIQAIANGDLTPPVDAEIEFNTLTLPDNRTLSIHTVDTAPLDSIYTEPAKRSRRKASPANPNGGILGTATQTAKDQVNSAINARTHGIADIVRSPNKKEKLVDFLWAKLPYHPRYVRRGTRVDASLRDPLSFGAEAESYTALAELGSQPGPGSVVHARLVTPLDSASAAPGQPVDAIVTVPLFSADQKLVLPEGTRLTGAITVAKKARSFHRAGRLRFVFQNVILPPAGAASPARRAAGSNVACAREPAIG